MLRRPFRELTIDTARVTFTPAATAVDANWRPCPFDMPIGPLSSIWLSAICQHDWPKIMIRHRRRQPGLPVPMATGMSCQTAGLVSGSALIVVDGKPTGVLARSDLLACLPVSLTQWP
jgi:hypothetical protein